MHCIYYHTRFGETWQELFDSSIFRSKVQVQMSIKIAVLQQIPVNFHSQDPQETAISVSATINRHILRKA